MEKEKNNKKRKEAKKDKNYLHEYFNFYKEKLFRKNLIIYIILLIVFFVSIVINLNSLNTEEISQSVLSNETASTSLFNSIFAEKLPLIALLVFAGITPFVYIPALGVIAPYLMASKLINNFYLQSANGSVVIASLGVITEMIGIALAMATGIYYCWLSSKKFRYNQSSGYSFDDIKKGFYKAANKKEKLKGVEKKIKQKKEKLEKLNVKIPYKELIVSGIISFFIVMIGTLISKGV